MAAEEGVRLQLGKAAASTSPLADTACLEWIQGKLQVVSILVSLSNMN